ncbi:hypothetical protein AFLA_012463 [Aspergillus flavus NRRL3357]|nr:hypothetical protein AFLA_012463 [Aspergillus flavus NRRL3357]
MTINILRMVTVREICIPSKCLATTAHRRIRYESFGYPSSICQASYHTSHTSQITPLELWRKDNVCKI